ncbi:MAG: NUDIX hydrolase [Candidatus Latescibacterota bacterium]
MLSNRWLRVRKDHCALPSRQAIDDYYVIELPPGALVLAVAADHSVLLVRQYKHGYGQEVLEFPAGNVEDGEDPEAAARRELREETGCEAGHLERLGVLQSKPARMAAATHVFHATDLRHSARPLEQAQEAITVVPVPMDQLCRLVAEGAMVSESSLAALAPAVAKLGWQLRPADPAR